MNSKGIRSQIDKTDMAIIGRLMLDARTPYTDIARELIVAPATIHVRMARLRRLGIVKGSRLVVDPSKLGYDMVAFVGILLEKGALYAQVVKALKDIPELIEAHYTTGTYSIFAKIICKSTDEMRQVLNDKIQHIKGVSRTETMLSLEESIHRPPPLWS